MAPEGLRREEKVERRAEGGTLETLARRSGASEVAWEGQAQTQKEGFPGSPVVENLTTNAGDVGLIPALGRFHMSRGN